MNRDRRATGSVRLSVFRDYFRAAHAGHLAVIVLLLYLANQANMVLSDWWLSAWAEELFPNQSIFFWLGIFVALGVLLALLTFLRTLVFTYTGLRASNRLHERLAAVVMQGTMAFFDTTPMGRVLARFASDMNKIDETLPQSVEQALFVIFSVAATFLVISSVTPFFLVAAVPILAVYVRIQVYYKKTALQVRRLDQQARGPLYSFFSESLSGLSSIRAFGRADDFAEQMDARIDRSSSPIYAQRMAERWLSLRLEFIGILIIAAAGVAAVFAQDVYPGLVGLSLAYSLRATGLLTFLVRSVTEAETQMTASEQVLLYVNTVDTEKAISPETLAAIDRAAPAGALAKISQANRRWLQRGEVEFSKVSMRYRPGLPLVLKEVSFTVPAGAKVGVCGRTGSGKSTCMLLLLRIVEPAEGVVRIDGRDVRDLSLEALRGAVAMIPQDPVLFSGTLRQNLDPFGTHSDAELLAVVDKVQLRPAVDALGGGLEATVAEYGENFSTGQRQLMCLARALLRNGTILLMDEATSSVDYDTDQTIQTLIREEFARATVITIAHRLNTIIDSDAVLVLSDGRRAEFGKPHELLQRPPSDEGPDGIFAKLVDETGKQSAEHLRKAAAASATERE